MRRRVKTLFAIALLGLVASPAQAWGPVGHRVITRIAMHRLSPHAAAEIKALLKEGDTLVDVCDWADHDGHDAVPGSAPWHYVNVPISAEHYDNKFCPDSGCVVSKVKHYRGVLADKKAPKNERARALLFLVHFVEDVHQPLHVGDNRDRGGNFAQVQFEGRGTNLHALWDSGLLHNLGGSDAAWVKRIEPLLTPDNVKAWSSAKVEDWADESLQAAKKAYHWPAGAKAPLATGATLGDDYAKMAEPILKDRMARAGVRLANELNAIFP
jgi:nuclease S1